MCPSSLKCSYCAQIWFVFYHLYSSLTTVNPQSTAVRSCDWTKTVSSSHPASLQYTTTRTAPQSEYERTLHAHYMSSPRGLNQRKIRFNEVQPYVADVCIVINIIYRGWRKKSNWNILRTYSSWGLTFIRLKVPKKKKLIVHSMCMLPHKAGVIFEICTEW